MFARLMGQKTMSPHELHRQLQDGAPVTVIDVNSRDSWIKRHVPGANHLDSARFTDSDLPPDKTAVLVFYCSNPMCRKAPDAARRARRMGYDHVRVMSAGISGWLAAKLPAGSGE